MTIIKYTAPTNEDTCIVNSGKIQVTAVVVFTIVLLHMYTKDTLIKHCKNTGFCLFSEK